jgi:hypothetical protein
MILARKNSMFRLCKNAHVTTETLFGVAAMTGVVQT